MNCPHCEYLLFNLTQPICPECGRGFDLAAYRFAPGSVSFNCPHCDQAYFGNDAHGLPWPRAFECVKCARPVSLAELRVVPQRPDVRGERVGETPWMRRGRTGVIVAWWQSVKMLMLRPREFYRDLTSPSFSDAWKFATLTLYVAMATSAVIHTSIYLAFGTQAGPAAGLAGGGSGFLVATVLLATIAPPIFAALGPVINALFIQLGLIMGAPERRPLEMTIDTVAYATAPGVLAVVPFIGDSIGNVWSLVITILGVMCVHRVTGWRASFAVLWPILICCGVGVGVLGLGGLLS